MARRPGKSRSWIRLTIAVMAVEALTGCAQLRSRWPVTSIARLQRPDEPPERPVDDRVPARASSDPYAARVAVGSEGRGDRGWVAQGHENRPAPSNQPPSGSMALAAPSPTTATPPETIRTVSSMPSGGPADPSPKAPGTAEPAADGQNVAIADWIDRGLAELDSYRNYRVRLTRQERVRGSLLPEEEVTLSIRPDPFAVRLDWPDGPNEGRQVIYSSTEGDGQMHIKLGQTLIPIPPMQMAPDSPLALANSRYPITEAGLRHILETVKTQHDQAMAGDPTVGRFDLQAPAVPPEFTFACVELLRETPSGEHWRLLLEESTGVPVLLEATDAGGALLERYLFRAREVNLAELDKPDAFDADVRFARGAAPSGQ